MIEFLIYLGKTAVALATFYMFFRVMLSKETFHRFNRIVLLSTAALSFVLPLCVITIRKVVTIPASVQQGFGLPAMDSAAAMHGAETATPWWPAALCALFVAGAVCILIHTAISIIKIRQIIGSGICTELESGEKLIITETDTAPFSWMNHIVISRVDYESGYPQILTHEKAHIALRHSWDILFVDLITSLQWFNPAIWMIRSDLRAIHEFEADDAVLRNGADIKEYQYLLIRKAVSKSGYSVANSFNHSTLKQRITMMSNKKSSRLSAMKALYIIPLVGISLAATAETKVDYLYDEPQAQSDTTSLKVIQSIGYSKEDGENSWRKKNAMELIITPDQNAKTVTVKYLNDKLEPEEKVFTDIDFSNDVWICNSGVITKDIADKLLKQENIVYASRYLDNGKKVNVIVLPSLEVRVVRLEGQDPKPLVVVDGIPMEKDFKLESINPDEIKNIAVLKDGDAVAKYGTAAKDGVIEVEMKNPQAAEIPVANGAAKIRIRATDDNVSEAMPLIVINGKTMEKDFDLNSIDPKNIESMNVLKDKASIEKYGEAAKNGVVEINLKKE
ncbi:MAG: TonB-dependent receptor plug domain-containing protein [Bacteroidales bacterium]|nr:TonB-dependent receptor plug domain-containing protein [Bacteroidales bacterium]